MYAVTSERFCLFVSARMREAHFILTFKQFLKPMDS